MNKSFKGVPLKYIGIAVLVILALIIGASLKKKPAKDSSDDYSKNVTESENKSKDEPYIPEGSEKLIKHYEDLTEENLKELYNVCNDENASHIAQEESVDTKIISDPEYVGYIFRYAKRGNTNSLALIYKETLDEYDISAVDHYRTINFSSLKKEDGKFSYSERWDCNDDYSTELECYISTVTKMGDSEEEFEIECDDHYKKYIGAELINTLSEIPEDSRKKLMEDAKSRIDYFPRDFADTDIIISDINFEGEMLIKGEGEQSNDVNEYSVVYSATIASKMNIMEPTKMYIPVTYQSVRKLKNGECDYTIFLDLSGLDYMMNMGYTSDEDMYRDCISSERGGFNGGYELSDSLKYLDEQYNRFKNED